MRILVTGDLGFIGEHLCRELVASGHDVGGWDQKRSNEQDIIAAPVHFRLALRTVEPDVVVHLAAKVGRLFGEDDVIETVMDNAGMTAHVAKACGELGIRLVYASTSEIYGDCGDEVCDEDMKGVQYPVEARVGSHVYDPHNIYGLSKRWGEEACELYAPEGLTIWRISMPYGPGLPAGRGRAAIVNMLDQATRRVEIPVHRGSERSWCWIGDTVRAMRLTIERTDGGTFNIGRDDAPVPMQHVAAVACNLTGAPYNLIREVDAPKRQTIVKRLSTAKIRALGWEPRVELREGMARTLSAMYEQAVAA